MNNVKTIGFSLAIAYCKKCKKIEGYNGNDLFSEPDKCRFCGGEMTTEHREKFLTMFDETFNTKLKKAVEKLKGEK